MEIPQLSWLTPLQHFKPRGRAGRPRKVNSAVKTWIEQLYKDHSIIEIAHILKLSRDTVAHYLGRQSRGG